MIAPQAPFEESATTEASRRCSLINWDVNRNPEVVLGKVLETFATGICVLDVQNMVPELLRISPILSVCGDVCEFVRLFAGRFLDRF